MPRILIDATSEYEQEPGYWGGLEILEFDCYNPGTLETTRQEWLLNDGTIWAPYNVEVQRIENDVYITYTEENHLHFLHEMYQCEDGDIIWGTHVLHNVVPGIYHGPSTWNGERGPGWKIEKPDGGQRNRRKSTIWRIQRGDQGVFRKQLLGLDGCCAISGEDYQNALEAAHIVPAHRGGREVLSNGILLRADLHRLYDTDPPKFKISPETGQIVTVEGFNYQGFALNGIQIDEAVLQRINDALYLRQQ